MENNDVIEILDDINENELNSSSFPNTNINNNEISSNNVNSSTQNLNYNNLQQESSIEQINIKDNINTNQSQEVQYDPIYNNKEEIKIEELSENEKSKSGLSFVIALFIIIGAFIVALPYIAKLFR